jgi:hypothetical protein
MAASKQKFPYTMHCPSCRVGIRIKNPDLVGRHINCPKCKKKIEVVTEDEDAFVSYGVGPPPEEEPEPEPTEEELEQAELDRRLRKRKETLVKVKYITSIVVLVALLAGIAGVFYYFVWVRGYSQRTKEEKRPGRKRSEWRMPLEPSRGWPVPVALVDDSVRLLPVGH